MVAIGEDAAISTRGGPRAGLAPLVIGSVFAIGGWWLAGRGLLGAFRPALVGASYSSDLSQPDAFLVQASVLAAVVGLAAALMLVVLGARGAPAARRAVAVALGGGLLVLGARAVLAMPDTRCAFDSYAEVVDDCASGRAALVADLLLLFVPGAIVLACLLAGGRRGSTRTT